MKRANAVVFSLLMMTSSLAGCLGEVGEEIDEDSDDTSDSTAKSWLFVQAAEIGTSNNNTLILETNQDVFAFTDRPDRLSGHISLEIFSSLWDPNATFTEVPPNAVLTWKSDDGAMAYAEVLLSHATWNNVTKFIEYDYIFEAGQNLTSNLSGVSLFIDDYGVEVTCEEGELYAKKAAHAYPDETKEKIRKDVEKLCAVPTGKAKQQGTIDLGIILAAGAIAIVVPATLAEQTETWAGCTDPEAENYDGRYDEDDGSCEYDEE